MKRDEQIEKLKQLAKEKGIYDYVGDEGVAEIVDSGLKQFQLHVAIGWSARKFEMQRKNARANQ